MERLISDLEKHSGKAGRVSQQGTIVPKYDVLAVRNACGDAHPTGISINLGGPVKKRSIASAYRGKNLPRHLATSKQNRVYRYSRPRCGMSGFFFIIKTQSTPI